MGVRMFGSKNSIENESLPSFVSETVVIIFNINDIIIDLDNFFLCLALTSSSIEKFLEMLLDR